jgi:uncharacterized oligopeptide transporter (OPT) family protein
MVLALFAVIALALGIFVSPLFGVTIFAVGFVVFVSGRRGRRHAAAGSPSPRAAEQRRQEEKEARIR